MTSLPSIIIGSSKYPITMLKAIMNDVQDATILSDAAALVGQITVETNTDANTDVDILSKVIKTAVELVQNVTKPSANTDATILSDVIKSAAALVGQITVETNTDANTDVDILSKVIKTAVELVQNVTKPSANTDATILSDVIKSAAALVGQITVETNTDANTDVDILSKVIKTAVELVQNVTKPPPVVTDKTIENVIESAAELVQQLTKVPSKPFGEQLKDWLDSMYVSSKDRSTLYVDYTDSDNNKVTTEYNANEGYKINDATSFTKWNPDTSIPAKA